MLEAEDAGIWSRAAEQGLTVVSKDSDFHQMGLLYGHPREVVWLRCGNAPTGTIAHLLREHRAAVLHFHADPDAAFLVLE